MVGARRAPRSRSGSRRASRAGVAGEIGHDGETREQLTDRVVATVERIADAHPDETVLVVTHGGAIRALRRHAAGDPGDGIENCGTLAVESVDGVLAVHSD